MIDSPDRFYYYNNKGRHRFYFTSEGGDATEIKISEGDSPDLPSSINDSIETENSGGGWIDWLSLELFSWCLENFGIGFILDLLFWMNHYPIVIFLTFII